MPLFPPKALGGWEHYGHRNRRPDKCFYIAFVKKYFQVIFILPSVLFVLYREAVKTLAANAGGRGFESHRGQNLFFTFYPIRVECEELFCKN